MWNYTSEGKFGLKYAVESDTDILVGVKHVVACIKSTKAGYIVKNLFQMVPKIGENSQRPPSWTTEYEN